MKHINENNRKAGAVLAFALVPLSGLATDVYLPSFPDMTRVFDVAPTQIQQTLAIFLISYGVAQFFAGTIMDSFGRYRPTMIALFIFALSNFLIIATRNIHVVYLVRLLQGVCAAFIAVGKRSFFIDAYTGDQQKHYTALLTIVWAAAPITAPFLGGFLQKHFGWTASFYFLSMYAILLLLLEWLFSGETLKKGQPFRLQPVIQVYRKLISAPDFSMGVLILGFSYSMVMVFNMSVPFIVEKKFHLSPVVTGYCALFSGLSLFFGGLVGKTLKINGLFKKLMIAGLLQGVIILVMFAFSDLLSGILMLMVFVVSIHLIGGAMYNLFFTYCLTRFPQHAGTAGGITSGGSYLVTSLAIACILSMIAVTNQHALAISYLILAVMIISVLLWSRKYILSV